MLPTRWNDLALAATATIAIFATDHAASTATNQLQLTPATDTLASITLAAILTATIAWAIQTQTTYTIPTTPPSDNDWWYVTAGIGALTTLSLIGGIIGILTGIQPAGNATQQTITTPTGTTLLIILSLTAVAPIEELIFRGLLQRGLQQHTRPRTAITIAALAYTAYHLNVLTGTLPSTLLTPILAHGLYNTAVLIPTLITTL